MQQKSMRNHAAPESDSKPAPSDQLRELREIAAGGSILAGQFSKELAKAVTGGNLQEAREVVEICAGPFARLTLERNWQWGKLFRDSPEIRKLLHISTFYGIADLLDAAGAADEADEVLRGTMAAFPDWSSPVVRLAERFYAREQRQAGDDLLIEFIARLPEETGAPRSLAKKAAIMGISAPVHQALLQASVRGFKDLPASCLWLQACFTSADEKLARDVVEACKAQFEIPDMPPDWRWDTIVASSPALLAALHITSIYRIEGWLDSKAEAKAADSILHTAIAKFPSYSGPVLKLATRYYERKSFAEGDAVALAFLEKNPGDTYVTALFARHAVDRITPDPVQQAAIPSATAKVAASVPAAKKEPAGKAALVAKQKPAEKAALVAKQKPAEKAAPVAKQKPAGKAAPAAKQKPVQEAASAGKAKPSAKVAPAAKKKPAAKSVSAIKEKPAKRS